MLDQHILKLSGMEDTLLSWNVPLLYRPAYLGPQLKTNGQQALQGKERSNLVRKHSLAFCGI